LFISLLGGCTTVLRKKFSASNFWKDCVRHKCTVNENEQIDFLQLYFYFKRVLHMLVNYVVFYLLNHLVNTIENIQYEFVRVMDFDKIYGQHFPKDLIYEIFMNSMLQLKAMHIFVMKLFLV
jgi:hypothetical protein